MVPTHNIEELKKIYPFVEKNVVMGMGKSGKFYSADLDGLESYILTKSGTVLIVDGDREIMVPSYPKLEAPEIVRDIPVLNEKFIAEYKVDGYNVRLFYLKSLNNFVALQRGGFICAQTTAILRESYSKQFMNFFLKYPNTVLCMEVVGKKSLNATNYEFNEKNWGFGNIGYFIFDVFDISENDKLGKWYDNDFLNELKKMDLSVIPQVGIYNDGNLLVEKMAEIDPHFDGVVLKSLNQRDREHIYKLRWEYFVNKFQNKIKIKDKGGEKSEKGEQIILSHFFQGYSQPELGLNEGISVEELKNFEEYIDELDVVVKTDKANIKNKVGEITDYLMKILVSKGNFDEDMQNKLLKGIKNRLGGFVGRGMSKEDRENKEK
ncbi:MAG: hypothetical protein COS36_05855 [Candidatus Altarchaeum sp. CG03_land_8_20_14_0_80_32_618]|uniref:RNA ligase domain-containing protein n=1 Tax=Candidatus Altarchaeum hamiconexum TaxID=1803513 RepID=A0A8J7Z1R3_9ARCH|nr:hypothetical protein [Candidatus Altarchaeum hamiconexum]OIQ05500.1 MAG: hypothetical protein AUK59_03685 [Candidatus Altarchaeum sp. CG2_30_32_3053]PIV27385.1 MAG: hypothetical protein COS36_05855 [Candidatus Altarchaeum sp. CG03_land_8_20_14_0_80_32_618]PIX49322.1 MAG: hypothetical protein COZ53_01045 [Candidatus Altarchaeum sp. CG_4_8_14_3_um_filter_33_2054]PJC15490.1 MAG: hypothetical protein CO063_01105 [Candidatus Altarchaeum sp. CG_4_9_14_0_8_um_filter_32_206]